MKIMTLNTWGGRTGKDTLLAFFEKYREAVDIFCLQEMWRAPYEDLLGVDQSSVMTRGLQEITAILEEHFEVFFHPHHNEDYGLALFVRKSIPLLEVGERFVHKYKEFVPEDNAGKHARNIQYVKIGEAHTPLTVINFHGLWNGQGKGDTEDRIIQSQNIIDFLKEQKGEIVFCGDFNLVPETKSLKMFEEFGLRNLITENQITSTRTSLYTKSEKYADYVFVSPGIHVESLEVLPEEVSDHAALLLEINSEE